MTIAVRIEHQHKDGEKKLLVSQRHGNDRMHPVVVSPGESKLFHIWKGMSLEIEEI